MARLASDRDFICFLGDHIMGLTKDSTPSPEDLRRQWRYWLDHEFAFARETGIDIYHLTSNHNTYNEGSEQVFREIFPEIPHNGSEDDIGLSYYVNRDDGLLLVMTNSASARLGHGRVETEWLARVLEEHRSVPHKIVLGHYPVLPVNGYAAYPRWRMDPQSGTRFWRLLVEHEVLAYVCSHVIAFDARVRDGVLQICSGGGGTRYGPTGTFMRGASEFFHFVDCALDGGALRYAAIDEHGAVRADLRWPPLRTPGRAPVGGGLSLRSAVEDVALCDVTAVRFEISARRADGHYGPTERETLVCGFDVDEGPPTVWIGTEAERLVVELVLAPGGHVGRWVAGGWALPERFAIEILPAMGPGGVILVDGTQRRTSLATTVADDLGRIRWPSQWRSGQGVSGPDDEPYCGEVEVSMYVGDTEVAKPTSDRS